jgi:hypothetical protein
MADPNHKPIPRDTLFLGGFTLGEYFALPDEEQARIWDEASEFDWDELEEVEVSHSGSLFGMDLIVTQDQPMITNWQTRDEEIQKHLDAMISQLPSPYHEARLPNIRRPEEEIIF